MKTFSSRSSPSSVPRTPSASCGSFHRVSVRHATSDVYISYPAQLERFCTFMLDDVQNRLQRLRRLEIVAQALGGNYAYEVHCAADVTCSHRVADVLEGHEFAVPGHRVHNSTDNTCSSLVLRSAPYQGIITGRAASCVSQQYTGGSVHCLCQSPDPDSRRIGKYIFHRTLRRSEMSSLIPPARTTRVRDPVSIRVR